MQDEGFHLRIPSQEAKAALNSATALCKWFDSDQAKDMIEEFNKALEGMHPEWQCSKAMVWTLSACGRHTITSIQSKLDTSKLGGVRTSKEYY